MAVIKVHLAETPSLRKQVLNIRRQVFVEEQKVPLSLEEEGDEESIHFLAQRDGLPAGAGRYRVKGPFVKVERIATLPESRGKGVATELMLFIQAVARETHPDLLQIIHAQKDVILFYQKLGWIPVGLPFEEAGISHQLMVHPPRSKDEQRTLACLSDPSCPQEIKTLLET